MSKLKVKFFQSEDKGNGKSEGGILLEAKINEFLKGINTDNINTIEYQSFVRSGGSVYHSCLIFYE